MAEPAGPNGGPNESKKSGGGYGKRPLWQWIVLYVIIAGIVYYGVYYFFIQKPNSSNGNGSAQHSLY